jgi:hypothetical protein
MATNTVVGILVASDGTNIPLKTEIAEGTETTCTTDLVYTGTAQNIGDFGQGKTITHGLMQFANGFQYAYILRQGVVESVIPCCVNGASTATPRLWAPITLMAGDLLRVMNQTAADRGAALCYVTNRGTQRIATVTPTGGATNALTDLQTGNSVGDTVQGQSLVAAWFTSVDSGLIETPGAVVVDALGNVVGSVTNTDPATQQAVSSPCSIPVNLNFVAQYLTSA